MRPTVARVLGLLVVLTTPAAAWQPPLLLEAFDEGASQLGAPGWFRGTLADPAHAKARLEADLARSALDDTNGSDPMDDAGGSDEGDDQSTDGSDEVALNASTDGAVEPVQPDLKPEEITKDTTISIGKASRGYLVNGVALKDSPRIKSRPKRNLGTPEMVGAIERGVDAVHKAFKKTQRLAVGDLSRQGGGPFRPHVSHQSGRDADIAYYTRDGQDQAALRRVTRRTIDAGRTFTLIQSWLAAGAVEYVFVDYRLQQPLYEYARDVAKVPAAQLEAWFQYPRGKRARNGVIRHLRGHADHMHVRFWAPRSKSAARAYIAKYGTGVLKPLPVYRKVKRGDSLWKLARRHKTTVKNLRKWNHMRRRSLLKPGQKLITGWQAPKLPAP